MTTSLISFVSPFPSFLYPIQFSFFFFLSYNTHNNGHAIRVVHPHLYICSLFSLTFFPSPYHSVFLSLSPSFTPAHQHYTIFSFSIFIFVTKEPSSRIPFLSPFFVFLFFSSVSHFLIILTSLHSNVNRYSNVYTSIASQHPNRLPHIIHHFFSTFLSFSKHGIAFLFCFHLVTAGDMNLISWHK